MTFERIRIATLLAFTIFLGLFVSPVNAQMNIEIKGVGQTLYPIAVTRFKDEDKLPVKISDVIRQNLTRSGYFRNVSLVTVLRTIRSFLTLKLGRHVEPMP